MRRFSAVAVVAAVGWLAPADGGKARAQYAPSCAPAAPSYVAPGLGIPFAGSSYSLGTPGYASGYYYGGPATSYYAPNYTSYYPSWGANPYRPAYYNPGPYYYTPAYSYTPGYYSYYYTPGYFRY